MERNSDVLFTSSSIKLPPFSFPHQLRTPNPLLSSLHLTLSKLPKFPNPFAPNFNPQSVLTEFLKFPFHKTLKRFNSNPKLPLLCCSSLSLTQTRETDAEFLATQPVPPKSAMEERVLISEVLVRSKDGEELERKDLESEALNALKACRPNSALTVREVQEDVHRIVASGYFCSCIPVAVDTRDGIQLVFQVPPESIYYVCSSLD